jgi:hypothetical protein
MREHMSSSPMNSPPHHGMPFIDADRAPSGRNRHMSGRRHSHARLEEEVQCNYAEYNVMPFSFTNFKYNLMSLVL